MGVGLGCYWGFVVVVVDPANSQKFRISFLGQQTSLLAQGICTCKTTKFPENNPNICKFFKDSYLSTRLFPEISVKTL